jgi:Na+/phosphate symporter
MLIAIWPLIICVAGLILYFAASNAKPTEVGRIMFAVGLFWLVFKLVGKTLSL